MACFNSPAELAAALYNDERRPIDRTRVEKFVRHLVMRADYDVALAALPEQVRAQVDVLAEPLLRRKFGA